MRVHNCFQSIQGEASYAGVPMHFIRLAGCSVRDCFMHPVNTGLCDTDLRTKYRADPHSLFLGAQSAGLDWVCITGGEPTDQDDLPELVAMLRKNGFKVMLQTAGTRQLWYSVDCLAVAPKTRVAGPSRLQQVTGHDLKLVYQDTLDPGQLRGWHNQTHFMNYWLQPEWSRHEEQMPEILELLSKANRCGAGSWRLSIQQHKYIGVS